MCGCSSSKSPAFIYPPESTPAECLSSRPASRLVKRTLAFSQNVGTLPFTCNTDTNQNPFQDCLNSMNFFCHRTYINTTERVIYCRYVVDTITNALNRHWKEVRKQCGQWSYDGVKGDFRSERCLNANTALRGNATYFLTDGSTAPVTFNLTETVRLGLWSNMALAR